jgi:DNA-binding NtrC family response regulator
MSIINPPQIMGKSSRILKVFEKIRKIASKDIPVLISGENGTYKELVARIIHDNSPRQGCPFIAINLASLPGDLAEAELFGRETKTATEGHSQKSGKIAEASGGTLFIEEIFTMDGNLRDKMIPLILDRGTRLNDHEMIQSGVRVIGTTCRNLGDAVKKGQCLDDLFQAFHGVHLRIPSLRERKEDIQPLVQYFLNESARKFDTGRKELSKDAKDYLTTYDWPGNIRELENMIKRATILCQGPLIEKKHLLMADIGSCSIKEFLEEKLKRYLKEMMKLETCNLYDTVLSEVERSLIAIVLQETDGNQMKTSKTLGINRNTLRSKIKEYKIRI